jgi:hypothetical protein
MNAYSPPAWKQKNKSNWAPAKLGAGNIVDEVKRLAPEFKEAGNWFLVTAGFVAGDLLLHQAFPNTREEKTPPYYYGDKLIWTIPGLLVGRLLSDYVIKGSDLVRAITIATTTNLILAVRYLRTYPPGYIATVMSIHEALLVPLCLLITGPSPATGFFQKQD